MEKVSEIYAIRAKGGYVKIGRATNTLDRLDSLQTGTAVPLSIEAKIVAHPRIEPGLHLVFQKQRVSGEWFSLSRRRVIEAFGLVQSSQRVRDELLRMMDLHPNQKQRLLHHAHVSRKSILELFANQELRASDFRRLRPARCDRLQFGIALPRALMNAARQEAVRRKISATALFKTAIELELQRSGVSY